MLLKHLLFVLGVEPSPRTVWITQNPETRSILEWATRPVFTAGRFAVAAGVEPALVRVSDYKSDELADDAVTPLHVDDYRDYVTYCNEIAVPSKAMPPKLDDQLIRFCIHSDNDHIRNFATKMINKMGLSRDKGRSGWDAIGTKDTAIADKLIEAVHKGDPVDVANYAMMLSARNAGIDVLGAALARWFAPDLPVPAKLWTDLDYKMGILPSIGTPVTYKVKPDDALDFNARVVAVNADSGMICIEYKDVFLAVVNLTQIRPVQPSTDKYIRARNKFAYDLFELLKGRVVTKADVIDCQVIYDLLMAGTVSIGGAE